MHGGLCERRHRRRHMWQVPASTTPVVAVSTSDSLECFSKDGRKIRIGDCALFKPPQDSPPFVGLIRRLTVSKEEGLKLAVNWLYRPADIKLVKGSLLEAAPNEIFYSFHKDEILAASLLHPCKVAFLRKGVELPSGISSFVCRRVYDIEGKCVWWLTDQDYINLLPGIQERQEEVDKLLDKTRQEMHGATQPGGRSPRPSNGPTTSPQVKSNTDTVQNSSSHGHLQVKGKKRDRNDQSSDIVRRERFHKAEDGDSGLFRSESMLKSEIAKITDKGALINYEGVQKLVQLMQPDTSEKKVDLAGRVVLLNVLAYTYRFDCLGWFVQFGGLPVLDEWLQEVHKGKIGDSSSTKESDKSIEEFLLALLRAVDKLPVNLEALQTCNIGKSVNHLRSHKNSEIQKKARSLVDIWKKRVEAEMNMIDEKSRLNRAVSWPSKPVASEICHAGSRRTAGSSEVVKSSVMQTLVSKSTQFKADSGEPVGKFSSTVSPGPAKSTASVTTSVAGNSKDSNSKITTCGISDQRLATINEEKSSSSIQSQDNTQSCSADQTKTLGSICKEDAKSSCGVSEGITNLSTCVSWHRKSSNGLSAAAASGSPKGTTNGKFSSSTRSMGSEKLLPTVLPDTPLDHGNGQRLIVRLPNSARSPAASNTGGSLEDPAVAARSSSPPAHTERNDEHGQKFKGNNDALQVVLSSNSNMEEVNQDKDDRREVNGPGNLATEECEDSEVARTVVSSGTTGKSGNLYDASFSSINALVESCVKFSEASATAAVGDELGMNLLASVAAGEISKCGAVSPSSSPRNTHVLEACSSRDVKSKHLNEDFSRNHGQIDDGPTCTGTIGIESARPKDDPEHSCALRSDDLSKDSEVNSCKSEEKPSDHRPPSSSFVDDVQQKTDEPFLAPAGKIEIDAKGKNREKEGDNPMYEQNKVMLGQAGARVQVARLDTAGASTQAKEDPSESSLSCSSEVNGKVKRPKWNDSTSGILLDPKVPVSGKPLSYVEKGVAAGLISGDNFGRADTRNEKADETKTGNHVQWNEEKSMDPVVSDFDQRKECPKNLNNREVPVNHPHAATPHEESSASLQQETELKLTEGAAEDIAVNCSATGPDMAVKLDFDLNEGFPSDEGNQGELRSPSAGNQSDVHLPCPFLFPMTSVSGNTSSITFAAAAKGPFLPPENLLRSKVELGWKGSAATSAFRPAEPRKLFEMSLSSGDVSLSEACSTKQGRPHLDIDLNVPDERTLEDVQPSISARQNHSESVTHLCSVRGLDLDLNRADETPDLGQFIAVNSCRPEIPSLPVRSSFSNGACNGELKVPSLSRGFDLNNGPVPDELGSEMAMRSHLIKCSLPFASSVPGVRMNSSELGNFTNWFPPGNSYSSISIPSILPGRVEQSYPAVAASGAQRGVFGGPPASGPSFGPEIYRGPVLSSSPAVAFPSATPFQYPGFPFETSFPLSSNSFSASSSGYLDSSSGGAICFPAIPSQLMGPAGVVSSHYPRPYVVSLPGATTSVHSESRKWGTQILDLNSGPGPTDLERRDERVMSALRQLPIGSSQAMIDEQLKMYQVAGGLLKRKEPDGGWDADRGGYKQPTWK